MIGVLTCLYSARGGLFGPPLVSRLFTIDWDMKFGHFQTHLRHLPYKDENGIVLELKYDTIFEKEADRITQHIPFRLTKNSKYVNGVSMVMAVL